MPKKHQIVAYNGQPGAFAHIAALEVFPRAAATPTASFAEALHLVKTGKASHAIIPIENSTAGRVMDVHHLLPESGLKITREHFLKIHLHLAVNQQTSLKDIKIICSHEHALAQCRSFIHKHKFKTRPSASTSAAAMRIAENHGQRQEAALTSDLAADLFGLKIIKRNVEDKDHNTTRFIIMEKTALPKVVAKNHITSFVFEVRHVPAALYKALGGFATNGINLLKLESYLSEGSFIAAQFYAEAEDHYLSPAMRRAFDELKFYTRKIDVLGCYPTHSFRHQHNKKD